jgi:hypothetical protein
MSLTRTIAALSLLSAASLIVPRPARAVDGFDQLRWGMSPEQVQAAYPGLVKHDPKPKGAPEGSVGGRLVIGGGPQLFDEKVELSCFFTASGLSVVRILYGSPKEENVTKLLDWYRPHWGEPIATSERDPTHRKRTWAWPWEGVEFRSVEEDGAIQYQRVDFSEAVRQQWTTADAMVCAVLPSTSSCPFPDRLCAQQDASMGEGRREQPFDVAGSRAEATCTYADHTLKDVRLNMDKPSDLAVQWLEQILMRRLGTGAAERFESAETIREDTAWPAQGVELRVLRQAAVKTATGWSGPPENLRVKRVEKRVAAEPAAAGPSGAEVEEIQPAIRER